MKTVLALLLFLSLPAFNQSLPPRVRQNIDAFYNATDKDLMESAGRVLKSKSLLTEAISDLFEHERASLESTRVAERDLAVSYRARVRNVQVGESAATGGTSSLTSLANAADLFSAAFESGALAKQSEGTVTTLRVSGYGVYTWLSGSQRPCAVSNPFCDTRTELNLRGLSGSISIDNSKKDENVALPIQNSNGTTTLLGLVNRGGRISSASVRYEFLRRIAIQELERKENLDKWREAVKTTEPTAADLTLAFQATMQDINREASAAFEAWRKDVQALVDERPVNQAEFEQKYLELITSFLQQNVSRFEDLRRIVAARRAFHAALDKALRDLLFRPALTLEYVYSAPAAQLSFSGVRFIADSKKLFGSASNGVDPNLTGTINLAVNWYNEVPQAVRSGHLRDAQLSAQLDRALGSPGRKVRSTVSLASYYQYQANPAILKFDQNAVTPGPSGIALPQAAAAVLDTEGHIAIVQGKLTIRLTEAISIPLAVSWANRTELIKAATVKGQFGLNLVFDNLFK